MEKVLLVVGASSDIGLAVINKVKQNYDRILAHYNHMNDGLRQCKEQMGEKMLLLQADLSDKVETARVIKKINDIRVLPTHILHLPAPLCENAHFHKIEWEVFQREIDISLRSLVMMAQEFLPHMAKQRRGKLIVMLSFVVNNMPPSYCSNYVVTKYALLGLVKSLAVEYASKGITVNGVSPAWVETKFINNQSDILIQKNAELCPLGRNLKVDEVIPTIDFLLSDGSDCINGQNIFVTCGR